MSETDWLDNVLVDKESFGRPSGNGAAAEAHLAFGVDGAFVRGMGVAIISLILNNPQLDFVFHICTYSLDKGDVSRLREIAEKHDVQVHIYRINDGFLRHFPTFEHLPVAIYYRIVLANILTGTVRRLLYLDADIVCLRGISELLEIEFGDKVICVVAEENEARVRTLNLKQGKYFNSGVLYFDLDKWGEGSYTLKILHCLEQNRENFTLPDQDALNSVLDGKAKFLGAEWNRFYDMAHQEGEIEPDTFFMHYYSAIKPWERICRHPAKQHYLEYEKQSPWADIPPTDPITASKMEILARQLWNESRKKEALGWYARYVRKKFL